MGRFPSMQRVPSIRQSGFSRLRFLVSVAVLLVVPAVPLRAQVSSEPPAQFPSNKPPPGLRTSAEIAIPPAFAAPPTVDIERLPNVDFRAEAIMAPLPSSQRPSAHRPNELCETYTIDLATALRLADRVNPEIGLSRQAIVESLALPQGARALLLPSLSAGMNYHQHTGNVQQNDGAMLSLSQKSLYLGGGAQAVSSQTPAVPAIRIFSHMGDAIFEPLAARQQTVVRQFDASATFNSVLLSISTRYLDLMAAEARLDVWHRSQRDAGEFVRVTRNFAEVGQGRAADAHRAMSEAALVDSNMQRAGEQVAVAAAELSRLLNLDPSVRLKTIGGPIPIVMLVDPAYRLDQLIDVALRRRPELAARQAQITEAETRYRQERTRPLLPTISVGFSGAAFGGGSNLTKSEFGDFGGRTDFDVFAVWTAQNLGTGNVALARGRRAQADQALAARTRAVNLVRREVAEAYAQSAAAQQQIDISQRRLAEAEAGFQEELGRIRGGEGLPIELLDNLTRAIDARLALVAVVTTYDQAQFRLFVALGQPPTLALPNAEAFKAAPVVE